MESDQEWKAELISISDERAKSECGGGCEGWYSGQSMGFSACCAADFPYGSEQVC